MFKTPLDERVYVPDEWVLLAPLVWDDGAGGVVTVPRGFITDHASVPKPLRGMIDVNGASRKPAVLHDFLYCSQRTTRAAADALLRAALEAEGVGVCERNVFYVGVRLGGWYYWNKRAEGLQSDDFVPPEYWSANERKLA